MKQVETYILDAIGDGSISAPAIENLRFEFKHRHVDEPEELVVHPGLLPDFYKQLRAYDFLNLNGFHGLKIIEDHTLKTGEWRLRKTSEITRIV